MYKKFERLVNFGNSVIKEIKKYVNNNFWNDTLDAQFILTKKIIPKNIHDLKDASIWYNENINIDNKPIFYTHCIQHNIFHQVFDD